jgi:hypothetical protein
MNPCPGAVGLAAPPAAAARRLGDDLGRAPAPLKEAALARGGFDRLRADERIAVLRFLNSL